jgi:hypothetical protein
MNKILYETAVIIFTLSISFLIASATLTAFNYYHLKTFGYIITGF